MFEILANPIPQDPAYFAFADQRRILGVPHFWNVASNLPFLAVGLAGLKELRRHRDNPLHIAWIVFYAGIALTTFGSGWFHLDPNNESLAWDRLTMVIGFMSFVAIVIGEYLSVDWGKRLLVPLLLVGVGSVAWWLWGESQGAGDLRPYALVQFAPMILIPVVVIINRHRSDLGLPIAGMIFLYVLAKVFEHFDAEIFALGNLLSGHSLKHVAAALAAACLTIGLRNRIRDFPK